NNDGASSTTLGTTDLYTAQTYDPTTEGGFQSINFHIDDYIADAMNGNSGKVIAFAPVIEQGGYLYDAGLIVSTSNTWTSHSWSAYTSNLFYNYSGSGPTHPDFSSAGAPMTFGYYDSLGIGPSFSPYPLFHAVDNFNVQVVQKLIPTSGQYVVNVDLGNATPSDTYSGQGGIASPGNTWNAVDGGFNPVGALVDSQGNQTTVGYSWKTQANNFQLLGNYPESNTVFDSSRNALMDDGSYDGTEGDTTPDKYGGELYINGLIPNGHYNLALYGVGAGPSETYLTKFTVNGTSQTPTGPIDNDAEGGNYIVDNNVIADANGEIRVQVHNANYYDPDIGITEGGIWVVNGFQVQSTGATNPTWTGGSGNWSSAGSWSAEGVPSGAGAVAEFDNAASPVNVTVDAPQTVGTLGFNSDQKFTLSGSAITLDGNGYDSMINVTQGAHEIAAPINVVNGETEIVISNNASLKLSGKLTGLVSRVSLGLSSTLDLTSNSMDVEYFGNDPYSEILADFQSAYDSGKWDGTGLTSSVAANSPNANALAIGIVDNAAAGWTTFENQPITSTSVLIRPTWYGDANLDGVVDATDLALLNAGEAGGLTGWQNGDFNYDGKINADDLALFMLGNASQTGPLGSVPEPASALVLALAPLLMHRRRRQ
ncbi:MAG TPA: dockerin type I repeat-containing protein, partial [Tepidisphaeraceae bacterium]